MANSELVRYLQQVINIISSDYSVFKHAQNHVNAYARGSIDYETARSRIAAVAPGIFANAASGSNSENVQVEAPAVLANSTSLTKTDKLQVNVTALVKYTALDSPLDTTNKTLAGAINEINTRMSTLSGLNPETIDQILNIEDNTETLNAVVTVVGNSSTGLVGQVNTLSNNITSLTTGVSTISADLMSLGTNTEEWIIRIGRLIGYDQQNITALTANVTSVNNTVNDLGTALGATNATGFLGTTVKNALVVTAANYTALAALVNDTDIGLPSKAPLASFDSLAALVNDTDIGLPSKAPLASLTSLTATVSAIPAAYIGADAAQYINITNAYTARDSALTANVTSVNSTVVALGEGLTTLSSAVAAIPASFVAADAVVTSAFQEADTALSSSLTTAYTTADAVVTSAFQAADTALGSSLTTAYTAADSVVTSAFQAADTALSSSLTTAYAAADEAQYTNITNAYTAAISTAVIGGSYNDTAVTARVATLESYVSGTVDVGNGPQPVNEAMGSLAIGIGSATKSIVRAVGTVAPNSNAAKDDMSITVSTTKTAIYDALNALGSSPTASGIATAITGALGGSSIYNSDLVSAFIADINTFIADINTHGSFSAMRLNIMTAMQDISIGAADSVASAIAENTGSAVVTSDRIAEYVASDDAVSFSSLLGSLDFSPLSDTVAGALGAITVRCNSLSECVGTEELDSVVWAGASDEMMITANTVNTSLALDLNAFIMSNDVSSATAEDLALTIGNNLGMANEAQSVIAANITTFSADNNITILQMAIDLEADLDDAGVVTVDNMATLITEHTGFITAEGSNVTQWLNSQIASDDKITITSALNFLLERVEDLTTNFNTYRECVGSALTFIDAQSCS